MPSPKDFVDTFVSKRSVAALLLCTTVVVLFSYGYNIINVEKSRYLWKLSFGSRYVITVSDASSSLNKIVNRSLAAKKSLKGKGHPKILNSDKNTIHILLWSNIYRRKPEIYNMETKHFLSYGSPERKCPINYRFSSDRDTVQNYSAILVHVSEPHDLPLRYHTKPWVLEYDQSPMAYPSLSEATFMKLFTYSLGYRRDSDFFNPKVRRPVKRAQEVPFDHSYDYAASVHSNCEPTRTSYLKELLKYFRIWFFGDCLRNVERSTILKKHENGFQESKMNLTKLFKFTLAFMSQDCDDYIDEQLSDAWDVGSVPVFMGTKSIKEMMPSYLKKSFIQVSDFENPKSLGDYMKTLVADKESYRHFLNFSEPDSPHSENSPLLRVWYPQYSLGCQMAMKILKTEMPNLRFLQPIKCIPKPFVQWIGKSNSSVVNDH